MGLGGQDDCFGVEDFGLLSDKTHGGQYAERGGPEDQPPAPHEHLDVVEEFDLIFGRQHGLVAEVLRGGQRFSGALRGTGIRRGFCNGLLRPKLSSTGSFDNSAVWCTVLRCRDLTELRLTFARLVGLAGQEMGNLRPGK